jgi:hypothetical protein
MYSHFQAEYKFIVGENIQYNTIKKNVRDEISPYTGTEVL